MTKRIVSGIFILTALGALGVILAGALTSGEQLIVRFLTAVIVAALGLYVISDLRLQADDDAKGVRSTGQARLTGIDAPPNSTAAFMATVTRKGDSNGGTLQVAIDQDAPAEDERIDPHEEVVGATSSSTSEQYASAVVEDAESLDGPPVPSILGPAPVTVRASELPALTGHRSSTFTGLASDPAELRQDADDVAAWPSALADEEPLGGTDVDGEHGVPLEIDADSGNRFATMNFAGDPSDFFTEVGRPVPPEEPVDEELDATGIDPDEDEDEGEGEAVAVSDFAYSGEIDTPDFEWPAAPGQPAAPEQPIPADVDEPVPSVDHHDEELEDRSESLAGTVDDQPVETIATEAVATEGNADLAELVASATRANDEAEAMTSADEFDPAPDADTLGDAVAPGVDIGIPAAEWFRGGSPIDEAEETEPVDGMVSAETASDDLASEEPEAADQVEAAPVGSEPVASEEADETDPVESDDLDADDGFERVNGTHRPLPSPFVDRSSLSAAEYADAPLAPIIDLRDVATTTGSGIESAIRSGEIEVITALIEQGMLSTDGPISDRDVRTMVYVAFTSNELRKLLLAGGSPEGPNPGLDLGPVELFDRGIEAPKTFYPGLPAQSEARSQLG